METTTQSFGIREALAELGINERNLGTSTGQLSFASGDVLESYSPVTGELIATVVQSTKEDYEKAMSAAQSAFLEFRLMPAPKRGEIVRQFGEKLRAKKEA